MGAAKSTTPRGGEPARILVLAWRDTHHPDAGGSEIYIQRVAEGLVRLGHEVTIATALYPGADRETRLDSGVRIVRAGGRLSVYREAMRHYRRGEFGRPDVVLEVQNGVPYLSRLWARDTRHVVLVHHVHKAQWHLIFGPVLARVGWWIESVLAPRMNRGLPYLTISEASKRELVALGIREHDITVAYSGTDPAPHVAVERTQHPRLIVLGRLVPHKQVEMAIDAVAILQREFPDLELVIAGDGWWRENLERHAAAAGVGEHVHFAGFVSEADKQHLLAGSWAMLMPSRKEGWGLVVAEAGLQQTPAIAFRDGGGVTESIVHDHTGTLVDNTDLTSFVDAVRTMIIDEGRRLALGEAAREHALGYTWDRTTLTVRDVLVRAVEGAEAASDPVP